MLKSIQSQIFCMVEFAEKCNYFIRTGNPPIKIVNNYLYQHVKCVYLEFFLQVIRLYKIIKSNTIPALNYVFTINLLNGSSGTNYVVCYFS
jgi:hypothetical protein